MIKYLTKKQRIILGCIIVISISNFLFNAKVISIYVHDTLLLAFAVYFLIMLFQILKEERLKAKERDQ
jgi:hypothetical protein